MQRYYLFHLLVGPILAMLCQRHVNMLQMIISITKNPWLFFIEKFGQKNPPYGLFAPMSNLTKVPYWTSQLKLDHFD